MRTFRRIRQMFEPRIVVLSIDEFSEMEIRPTLGVSCRRLIYKDTNTRDDMTTMRCFLCRDRCVCIGVKYLQYGFTPIQTHAMTWRRCVAFFFGMMRLYRGKIFARWVYKDTNARDDMTMRCGLMRLYRGKIFARWVYPYTNTRDEMTTMRCFFSGLYLCKIFARWVYKTTNARDALLFFLHGCVCIGVKYLQDGFTKLQTHAMSRAWHDDALLFSGWLRLYRGKMFARWVYKTTNARDDMTTMRCFFFWMVAFV
jgi:hypothetical protein